MLVCIPLYVIVLRYKWNAHEIKSEFSLQWFIILTEIQLVM